MVLNSLLWLRYCALVTDLISCTAERDSNEGNQQHLHGTLHLGAGTSLMVAGVTWGCYQMSVSTRRLLTG